MKQTVLIALLALTGLTALPAAAADPAAAAATASATAAQPENLTAAGKPCGKGGGMGMGGMPGIMAGEGRAGVKPPCDYKQHADINERIHQLERRIDALQTTIELLVKEPAE